MYRVDVCQLYGTAIPSQVTIPVKMPGSETAEDWFFWPNFFLRSDKKFVDFYILCRNFTLVFNKQIFLVSYWRKNLYTSSTHETKLQYVSYLSLLDLPWLRCCGIAVPSKCIMVACMMYIIFFVLTDPSGFFSSAGILEQSMGAGNRLGVGLSYRPARLHRLAESIPWFWFLAS